MEDKEAIKTVEIAISEVEWDYPMEYAIAFERAILALEKQIPMKPSNITVEKYKVSYECPKCGTKHINEWCGTEWKLPFCSICGQALDWSDTE